MNYKEPWDRYRNRYKILSYIVVIILLVTAVGLSALSLLLQHDKDFLWYLSITIVPVGMISIVRYLYELYVEYKKPLNKYD